MYSSTKQDLAMSFDIEKLNTRPKHFNYIIHYTLRAHATVKTNSHKLWCGGIALCVLSSCMYVHCISTEQIAIKKDGMLLRLADKRKTIDERGFSTCYVLRVQKYENADGIAQYYIIATPNSSET